MSLNRVYIAIGSNIGNWKNNFNQAVKLISKKSIVKKFASIYLSNPYGYEDQNYFFNSAIELQTTLSPFDLFYELQMIERKLQKNKIIKNGPRKIDLDIIFFNSLKLNSKKLTIPHQSVHLRDFVLLPLIEINPFIVHPIQKKTVKAIYKKLKNKYVFKIKQRSKESLVIY